MEAKQFTTTILTAAEGKSLTQADNNLDIRNRIIASCVAIGANDSASNWVEITKAQADEYKAAQEAAIKADEEAQWVNDNADVDNTEA